MCRTVRRFVPPVSGIIGSAGILPRKRMITAMPDFMLTSPMNSGMLYSIVEVTHENSDFNTPLPPMNAGFCTNPAFFCLIQRRTNFHTRKRPRNGKL